MSARKILAVAAIGAIVGAAAPTALASVSHQEATVSWHGQQMTQGHSGQVPSASASLVRNRNGISYRINTTHLTPGNAFTLWLVVINNPAACSVSPCSGGDILLNPATDSQVRYTAGHVAGGSGRGTFAGSVKVGPLSGWLPGGSLGDPWAAEIQLVLNDHGPMIPEYMPGMIKTYRGGCAANSPFPPIFPAAAIADGEIGPNTCRLFQAAVFGAP